MVKIVRFLIVIEVDGECAGLQDWLKETGECDGGCCSASSRQARTWPVWYKNRCPWPGFSPDFRWERR